MAKRCANVCYNYSGRVSAAVSSALTGRILTEVGIKSEKLRWNRAGQKTCTLRQTA